MTANNPSGDFPDYTSKYFALVDALRDTFGNQWIQPTDVGKCGDRQQQVILKLTDRIAAIEEKLAALQTRIEWMENYDKEDNPIYDKEDNPNSSDDSSF